MSDDLTGAPPEVSAPKNTYLDLLRTDADQRKQSMAGSVTEAVGVNPDQYSAKRKVAAYLGYPVAAVEAMPSMEQQAQAQKVQADAAPHPALQRKYSDADFAKLAHDDSGVLAMLGNGLVSAARYMASSDDDKGLANDVKAALLGAQASYLGVGRAAADMVAPLMAPLEAARSNALATGDWRAAMTPVTFGNPAQRFADTVGRFAQEKQNQSDAAGSQMESTFGKGVASGVQSATQNALILPALLAGAPEALGLTAMSLVQGGQSYQKAREAGLDPNRSIAFGAVDAVVEYATEKIPLHHLLGEVKAGSSLLRTFLKTAGAEIPGEQIATILQDMNEWATLHPEKSFNDYLAERPSAAAQTLVATIIGTGGSVALSHVMQKVADNATNVQRAEGASQQLADLLKTATDSKLRERDPESFRSAVQAMADDHPGAPKAVYVDGEVLNQLPQEVQALLPDAVRSQIETAAQTGDVVEIPAGVALAVAPGTPLEQALVEHGRIGDPMAPSKAEAAQAGQQAGEWLQQEARTIIQQARDSEAMQASSDRVKQGLLDQLNELGRFRPAVNEGYATWAAAFYTTMAGRTGVTPEEMAAKYPLRLLGEQGQGAALNQQAVDTAEFKNWFGKSQVTDLRDRPLVVYHGTKANVETFDPTLSGSKSQTGAPEGTFFFSDSADVASSYTVKRQGEWSAELHDGANVMPVFLAVKKPLRLNAKGENWREILYKGEYRDINEIAELVKAEGKHDGVIVRNLRDRGTGDVADPIATTYIAFKPEQIKSATGNNGNYDPTKASILEQGPRGSFNPATLELVLSPNADLSTFFHETGHFFLEALHDMATQPDAPAEVREDMDKVLAWLGVTPEQWAGMSLDEKRPYHERFAESVEQYILEGKAPSVELAPTFRKFRAWVLNVYRSLQQFVTGNTPGPQLSDEVRGVLDRMLAAEDQIKQAEELAGLLPEDEATAAAVEKLAARSLRDLKWASNAIGRKMKELQATAKSQRDEIKAEVTTEVDALPEFRAKAALDALQTDPDFTAAAAIWREDRARAETAERDRLKAELYAANPDVKGLAKGQLWSKNRRAIDNKVDAAMIEWEAAHRKPTKGQNANEADLAVVADSFGFPDAETMLKAIDAMGSRADVIQGMTDQRMLEQHGDLIDEAAIRAAAMQAVHNEARAKSLATELAAQTAALGARTDTGQTNAAGSRVTVSAIEQAAKLFAAQIVANTPLRDLKARAHQHVAAERRAGRRWQEATVKGDTAGAIQAKKDQVLNNAAARGAMDAMGEANRIVDFFKRVVRDNDEKTVKKGRDPDIVNAARAVLAAYGVGVNGGKTALEYLELVEKHDPQLHATLQPSVQGALNSAQPLAALTMEQLQGLHEEIQALWHLAKRSRQMEVAGNLMDVDDAAQELQDRMQTLGVPTTRPGESGALTPAETRARWLQHAGSLLRRVEQWAEGMDGKWGGPFLRLVFQPVKDAAERYRSDRMVYRKAYQALVDAVAPSLKKGLIEAPELGYTFGRGHNGIGHAELLHALLHTGNESNKRKLLLGRKWATENVDGSMDTANWDAFVKRMQDTGMLTKAHYDFAQGVWDLLDKTKPLAQKAHRDVFGRYFAEVTADAFTTRFGTYRGGYVPAQADPRIVPDADLRALANQENENMAFSFPTTSKGFTKGRVEYNRPLMLDLRTIGQHIDKVLLFSHMEPAVRDVNKLLTRQGVSSSLGKMDPTVYSGMLTPWLNRSARQIVETPTVGDGGISRVLSAARSRAGMAVMFANVSNSIQQVTGFAGAFAKLKADGIDSSMMRSAAQMVSGGPKKMAESVATLSPFMANRMDNELSAINAAMDDILLDPNVYEKAQAWSMKHAYFLQSAIDNIMGPVIWTSAYNGALSKGHAEADAVRYADGVIRQTQGSTLPEDISRIETGPAYARMFTQFIGYFNMMANTNATAVKQIATEIGLKKGAGKALGVVTMGLLVPLWVAELIAQAFKGGPDDPDGDGYLDDWVAAVLGMGTIKGLLAMVPFVGQLANAGINRFNTNPADDRVSVSPAVSLLEAGAGVPKDIYDHIKDEGKANAARTVRDVASLVSIATGLPAAAAARPLGYMAGVSDGRISPTSTADAVRGGITGTASPQSKNR